MANQELLQIVDKYVELLRRIPPDSDNLEQQASELIAKYNRELLEAGPRHSKSDLLSSYRFLCFKAAKQIAEPENYDTIAVILTNHLRVENALRQYLKAKPKLDAIINEAQSFSHYVEIFKSSKAAQSERGRPFTLAMSEIEAIRNKFSHDFTYRLQPGDVLHMQEAVDKYLVDPPAPDDQPLDTYVKFCNYCYDFFVGGVWSFNELERRIQGLPDPEPDWPDFARRFSIFRNK